ncbi:uncharacterized protein LOC122659216 [Telopea speciosissima]|uniref:uncharacterized protein LOC122659216 n=1 Tax=Telopea speciosissima TaxID=54955 RepID=UPI001CC75702|nr:uncharacterized protein LOC122659216 [Telopea speciosissima]
MGDTITAAAAIAPSAALPVTSPYFLHSSDQPNASLVTPPLDGNNFLTWHRAMTMALEAKNKISFIDGSLLRLAATSPDLPHWIRCNSMVRSWIVHSTIPTIAHNILWFDSARDAWLDLHTRFSQKNAPRIFEICRAISTLSQGMDSISAYYTTLKGHRDELSSYRSLPACTCGSVTELLAISEMDYLMDFLQGLNDSYAAVRSQILLMDPLPSVPKVYSLLL